MKSRFLMAVCSFLIAQSAYCGSEQIIKQRARDLANQNNARQGVQPPTRAPSQPAQAQPAPPQPLPPQTPQQAAMARLQTQLAAIRPDSPATPEKTAGLWRTLIGAAQNSKPTQPSAEKLADALSAALSKKLLSNPTRNRLLQNLSAVLNSANVTPERMKAVVEDIEKLFQTNGIEKDETAKIAAAANLVIAETVKPKSGS